MINNLVIPNIKLFVFGTLRSGGRLDYYMEGTIPLGMYYTRGQLMMSETGDAFIDFNEQNAVTLGEVFQVNYYCLLRIHHIETMSSEFPKGYDLDIIPVYKYQSEGLYSFDEEAKMISFFYRRRNSPIKIKHGDWIKRPTPVEELQRFLKTETKQALAHEEIIQHIIEYLK